MLGLEAWPQPRGQKSQQNITNLTLSDVRHRGLALRSKKSALASWVLASGYPILIQPKSTLHRYFAHD